MVLEPLCGLQAEWNTSEQRSDKEQSPLLTHDGHGLRATFTMSTKMREEREPKLNIHLTFLNFAKFIYLKKVNQGV